MFMMSEGRSSRAVSAYNLTYIVRLGKKKSVWQMIVTEDLIKMRVGVIEGCGENLTQIPCAYRQP